MNSIFAVALVATLQSASLGAPGGDLETQLKTHTNLLDAATLIPGLVVRLAYATEDNFLGRNVYGDLKRCYLHRDASIMLKQASEFLQRRDGSLRLLAYDCVRPRSVQKQMWEAVKGTSQESYVANPSKGIGSIHNYGCAIDLTLANAQGDALPMGSSFDHFGIEAQPRHEARMRKLGKLSAEALANRLLLREVMVRAGFLPISNEWWHFNCAGTSRVRKNYRIIP